MTSNSMPLGSLAYSDLDTRWSLSPTSAPACDQLLPRVGQVGQRADLPGQMVEPGVFRLVGRAAGADLEQAEVVVVGRAWRAQERGPAGDLQPHLEAEGSG